MSEEDQKPQDDTLGRRRFRKQLRLLRLHDKEDRVRISLRLEPTVDEKLDQLSELRGLDRNTAISVAIAQDWIACFGPPNQTLRRESEMKSRKSKVDRDRKRTAADPTRDLLDEAMAAISVSREINAAASVAVKQARLQIEPQRIVLVCGCGARTTIQIANDGHASLGSKE